MLFKKKKRGRKRNLSGHALNFKLELVSKVKSNQLE